MPKYFFDTSALAKVYRKEIGSDFVDRVLSEPGSQCIISRLSTVEMESVFALKVRTGEIDRQWFYSRADASKPIWAGAVSWWLPLTTSTFEPPNNRSSDMALSKRCARSMRCNSQLL